MDRAPHPVTVAFLTVYRDSKSKNCNCYLVVTGKPRKDPKHNEQALHHHGPFCSVGFLDKNIPKTTIIFGIGLVNLSCAQTTGAESNEESTTLSI